MEPVRVTDISLRELSGTEIRVPIILNVTTASQIRWILEKQGEEIGKYAMIIIRGRQLGDDEPFLDEYYNLEVVQVLRSGTKLKVTPLTDEEWLFIQGDIEANTAAAVEAHRVMRERREAERKEAEERKNKTEDDLAAWMNDNTGSADRKTNDRYLREFKQWGEFISGRVDARVPVELSARLERVNVEIAKIYDEMSNINLRSSARRFGSMGGGSRSISQDNYRQKYLEYKKLYEDLKRNANRN